MKTKKLLVLIALLMATLLIMPSAVNAAVGDEFTEGDFKYKILDGDTTVELIKNDDYNSNELEVPAKVNYNSKEYTVISIGEEAFKTDYMLKTLILPYTIQTIGNSAFYDCQGNDEGLERINVRNADNSTTANALPTSLKTIGDYAFSRAFYLTNIAIPEGVIYDNEFSGYDLLKITDKVITDYSSLAMEISLLDIPIYFYSLFPKNGRSPLMRVMALLLSRVAISSGVMSARRVICSPCV